MTSPIRAWLAGSLRPALVLATVLSVACAGAPSGQPAGGVVAFTGARIFDGTGSAPMDDAVLLVQGGRVSAIGPSGRVDAPDGAEVVDLEGRFVVPGLINAHGHVGGSRGLESGPDIYTRELLVDQLALNARYGITTVVSLGGDGPEAVQLRDEQGDPSLERARIFVAGPVLNPGSPTEAAEQVAEVAAMDADWVKIRVDDFLGRGRAMAPEVYSAVIDEAHARDLPVAVHIVDEEDALSVVEAGADLIAHSVRDEPMSEELLASMREGGICLVPTLAREISTYVYADRPDFFDDPFFTREADPDVLEALLEPRRQAQQRDSESARWYREHLPVAQENLARAHEAGVGIAMGTDSGPPARFQGYFEHMELELMAEAGLPPAEILHAATGEAAACMGLDDVGTLEPGGWADFVVLREDPLVDVRNMRTIEEVRVAGNRVAGSRWDPADTAVE